MNYITCKLGVENNIQVTFLHVQFVLDSRGKFRSLRDSQKSRTETKPHHIKCCEMHQKKKKKKRIDIHLQLINVYMHGLFPLTNTLSNVS